MLDKKMRWILQNFSFIYEYILSVAVKMKRMAEEIVVWGHWKVFKNFFVLLGICGFGPSVTPR